MKYGGPVGLVLFHFSGIQSLICTRRIVLSIQEQNFGMGFTFRNQDSVPTSEGDNILDDYDWVHLFLIMN